MFFESGGSLKIAAFKRSCKRMEPFLKAIGEAKNGFDDDEIQQMRREAKSLVVTPLNVIESLLSAISLDIAHIQ
uniref:Phage protein n=1 Tax=Panagrellus redivivus TaxID=6233 RepID=A0A7E4W7D2_PANRE